MTAQVLSLDAHVLRVVRAKSPTDAQPNDVVYLDPDAKDSDQWFRPTKKEKEQKPVTISVFDEARTTPRQAADHLTSGGRKFCLRLSVHEATQAGHGSGREVYVTRSPLLVAVNAGSSGHCDLHGCERRPHGVGLTKQQAKEEAAVFRRKIAKLCSPIVF